MSFRLKLIILFCFLVILAVIPVSAFIISQMYQAGQEETNHWEQLVLEQRRVQLRNLTNLAAESVLDDLEGGMAEDMSETQARQNALAHIRAMRYDGGKGYFWIHEYQSPDASRPPVVVMHPTSPAAIGRPIDQFVDFALLDKISYQGQVYTLGRDPLPADLHPTRFLVEMNRVCAEAGQGFVTYFWTKPLPDGSTTAEGRLKLSYVRLMPEWNWVIGSGIYIDDIDVAKYWKVVEIKDRIKKIVIAAFTPILMVMLVALLLGISLGRLVTKSVREVDDYAKQITTGKYDIDIKVYGRDEFRDMREAFKDMLAAIQLRDQELRGQAAQLRELDEMKSDLLANVSHELRTPLVSTRGYTEMLLGGTFGPITDKQRKKLDICLRNIDNLAHMINDLLGYSEGEYQLRKMKFETVDLNLIAKEAYDAIIPKASAKDVTVELRQATKELPVRVDREKILQALLNLLANAVKFSDHDSGVILAVTRDGDHAAVAQVTDFGIGIDPRERARIFDRFYQSDSSRTRKHGGVGLGLAIVKEVVEKNKGTIAVTSSPGEGTTFTVTLPLWRREEEKRHD